MRDLFLQCMYVRTCLSHSGMSICAHVQVDVSHTLTHKDTRCAYNPSLAIEDKEERRFLTIEEG